MGAPSPPEPADPHRIPRFPIVLIDDVPLSIVNGYALAGTPAPIESYVRYYEQDGILRRLPLAPTNRPLNVLKRLEMSDQCLWNAPYVGSEQGRTVLVDLRETAAMQLEVSLQLLRLVASVCPPGKIRGEPGLSLDVQAAWRTAHAVFLAKEIRWDPGREAYVAIPRR